MKYAKVIINETATYTFTAEEIAAIKSGDTVLLSFDVKADAATKLTVTADLGTVINHQEQNKDGRIYRSCAVDENIYARQE